MVHEMLPKQGKNHHRAQKVEIAVREDRLEGREGQAEMFVQHLLRSDGY